MFIKNVVIHWYEKNKRDLPWRKTSEAYHIWVSEIFLQQTQVSRVIEYYKRFLERFPNITSLSNTSWEEFLPYFQGLGFYSRGKNMLKAAKYLVEKHNGIFPNDPQELERIPGIGPYTAAAIASFAFQKNVPAVDTNFIRVFERFLGVSKKDVPQHVAAIFKQLSGTDAAIINHAIMDLGSSVCTSKKIQCAHCPLQKKCHFVVNNKTLPIPSPAKPRFIPDEEYALLALYNEGKYLFQTIQKSPSKKKKCSLPIFFRPKGKDIRHLLKEKAGELWNINISMRPPFFTADFTENNKKIRISFSRGQILEGNIHLKNKIEWIGLKDLEEQLFEKYTLKSISRLKKMKLPS